MTHDEMKKDRIAVLEMYLENRKALKDQIYRLLKSAAEVRVGPEEFKTLADALNLVRSEPYSIRSEIRELKGEKH